MAVSSATFGRAASWPRRSLAFCFVNFPGSSACTTTSLVCASAARRISSSRGTVTSRFPVCSSRRRTFLIAAIGLFSSNPILKGASRQQKNTRPLMARTRRLQGPAQDGTAGLGFREDLGLELVDPGGGLEPCVGQEARFHARLGQEFGRVPGVLDRDLREQESAVWALGHAQAIHAEGDGLREAFRLLHLNQSRRGQDAPLPRYAV